MSALETEQNTEQRPERAVSIAKRVYAAELVPGDGRTVDVRIVPYGERAQANDGLGGLPTGILYDEEIAPGAFDHQLKAANRVHMNVEHEPGIAGKVGFGVSLASRSDGLHGSFRFLETHAGETALALVREGALGGVSFEATFPKSMRTAAGVIRRLKCNLVNIALCRDPAYESALILGLRTEDEPETEWMIDEEFLLPTFDPELAERCERLGISLPQRMMAHPAPPDTPSDEGTPDSGTRQDESQTQPDEE